MSSSAYGDDSPNNAMDFATILSRRVLRAIVCSVLDPSVCAHDDNIVHFRGNPVVRTAEQGICEPCVSLLPL